MNREPEPTTPHPEVNLTDPQVLPPTNAQLKQLFVKLEGVFDVPLSRQPNRPPSQEKELGRPGDFVDDEVQEKFPGLDGLSVVEIDDDYSRDLDCHLTFGALSTMYNFQFLYKSGLIKAEKHTEIDDDEPYVGRPVQNETNDEAVARFVHDNDTERALGLNDVSMLEVQNLLWLIGRMHGRQV